MRVLTLDGSQWQTAADVYDSLLKALEAPSWHARNLDALWDTVSGDDINGLRAPYRLQVQHQRFWSEEVVSLVAKIAKLFEEASASGLDVGFSVLEGTDDWRQTGANAPDIPCS